MFYAVIMAGGQGTRLWPMSRKKSPKQLQKLASERTLIQETVDRLLPLVDFDHIIISTTPEYALTIREQLPEIPEENYVLEPFSNNTAPACGLVTEVISRRDPEATVQFLPSDHAIKKPDVFLDILRFAESVLDKNSKAIITIGATPLRPDTGLGYIHAGKEVESGNNLKAFSAERFVEKPDLATAKEYLASGEYLWNCGMFMWKASSMLQLFAEHMPATREALKNIGDVIGKPNYEQVLNAEYQKTENISIDYGIMEKTKEILVIPGDFGWSDIGNWGALYELLSQVKATDVVSRGHHLGLNDTNSLVYSGDKLIVTVGLSDVVIVDTPDALLVCNRNQAQKVKDILTKLKEEGKEEYL